MAKLRSESFYELIVLRQIVSCTSNSPQFAGKFSELPFLPVTKGALGLYVFMILCMQPTVKCILRHSLNVGADEY